MNELRKLCERLLQGLDLDARALAARLGTIQDSIEGMPVPVTPFGTTWKTVEVAANRETGQAEVVYLVPAGRMTLATAKDVLGPYSESPRLHPNDHRKFVFEPGSKTSHPYDVRVVAYVSANEQVESLKVICSRALPVEAPGRAGPEDQPSTTVVWPRLLGDRANFVVRSWRITTLESVRSELERALGVQLTKSDGGVFECTLAACTLCLSSRPSEGPEQQVFDLVGSSAGGETISDDIAAHLRSERCDWYVPAAAEGSDSLDPDVIVSMLAPRWLAWVDGEEREIGLDLLKSIAELWLSAARRKPDPLAHVRRRRAEFQSSCSYIPPSSRMRVIVSSAIEEQLSVIEEELFDLTEMPAAERNALPETRARIAEWRSIVAALTDAVKATGVDGIREQHAEVTATLEKLSRAL